MGALNFAGWAPIRIYQDDHGELCVDWLRVEHDTLRAPFFTDGIQRALQHPFHQAFRRQTPLADLLAWAQASPGLQPSGIVFHVSRCGSTLVSQAFATLPDHVVLSEPPVLDNLMRSAFALPRLPAAQVPDTARAWMSAWGQPHMPGHDTPRQRLLVKIDCWATTYAEQIDAIWPNVPWVFVYRDPVEVMVSQMQQRALYLIPGALGMELAGVPLQEAFYMPAVEYCARCLGAMYADMVRLHRPGRSLLVEYRGLHSAIAGPVAAHFGTPLDGPAQDRMAATFSQHAKHPGMPFACDSRDKHAQADATLRALAERWITPHYEQLERLRQAQAAQRPATDLALLTP